MENFDDLSLIIDERKLTKNNQPSVENILKNFQNSEPNENPLAVENESRVIVSELNFNAPTTLESKNDNDESISKKSYNETQNSEPNENPVAIDNESRVIFSKLKFNATPTLESKNDNDESILKSSYNELQTQLENARFQHLKDCAEIDRLNSQIESQSAFCLNVGAVLAILMWRASNNVPEVINSILSEQSCQNRCGKFVSIADRIIVNFFKTYQEVLPPSSTDEYQFAMGMLGTVTNMSSRPEGRQFLIDNQNGKNLVKNIVLYLPKIPMNTGDRLKRLMMSILWNMSVNKDGLSYLYEVKIGRVVAYCLDEPNAERLQLLGLELLHSIMYKGTDPRRLDDLLKYVSIDKIYTIADTRRKEKIGDVAHKVLNYFTHVDDHFITQPKNQRRNK